MTEPSAEPLQSRQALVVPPPRPAIWPAVAGAFVCAATGFGLVWTLGIGRVPMKEAAGPENPVVADRGPDDVIDQATGGENQAQTSAGLAAEPDMLPLAADALPIDSPPQSDRWSRRSRFAPTEQWEPNGVPETQPRQVSLDLPDPPTTEPPRFSRYPAAQQEEGLLATAVTNAVEAVTDTSHDTDDQRPVTGAEIASLGEEPQTTAHGTEPVRQFAGPTPPTDNRADAPLPEDPGDMAAPPQPPVAPPTLDPVAAAFGAAPPEFGSQPLEPTTPPEPGESAIPAPLPIVAATSASPVNPLPQSLPPAAESAPIHASPTPASPFAAAPPVLANDPAAAEPAIPSPSAARLTTGAAHGRPGPLQLEGIQTPQVTVEKRGPREISVGKPARYEITVRNVGSATAHEVTLQDAVPQGTVLVATSPPATPITQASGDDDGALLWPLGTLPPGGQAVVTMEVMPQVEGEIGSVASVSFRTDASVRSRATKPDLRIECGSPQPVLLGRDVQVTITITNPGTGAATGVVLEGFLPDTVSHRSGRELEFDVGQLRPGESRTIDLVLGTRGPGVHAAQLVARADGGVEVKHQVPIEVTAPTLELAVDMPLRRFLQRPATCSIGMVNAGTAPARSIELAVQLPPGLRFVKANNAGWHDDRTHRVLWNLEELPAGETGTVQVVVMPVELGPQRITAAARSADGLACQAGHTCDVEGLAALSFEVLDSEDPIELDGVTDYVVRVGNQGTKPATGVRLAATLLGDLEPVEAQGPASHRIDNLTIAFEPLAKLAPAEEAVFRIRARGRRAGDQRIQVQLTSADQPAPITKEETTRVYADR